MKAAVYYAPTDLRVEEVEKPKVVEHGILMRVRACGICGSDVHFYKVGGKRIHPSMIMGHEFSGDVVEVGAAVKGIKVGDRVWAISHQPCFKCKWCKAGQYENCSDDLVGGIDIPGAYAEYVSVPMALLNRTVYKLDGKTSYEEGALIEPFGVGAMAVNRAAPRKSDKVAIFGAGIIGLAVLAALKAKGVSGIIVSEMSKPRLKLAGELGAKVLIDAGTEDVVGRIIEATGGEGLDIAVECTGVRKPFFSALKALRIEGKLAQVGVFTQAFEFNPVTLTDKSITVIGCYGGDYKASAALVNGHAIDFKKLISHTFPLDKIKEAFETQSKPDESVKVMVKP